VTSAADHSALPRPASLGTLVALLIVAVGLSYAAGMRLGPVITPEAPGIQAGAMWGAASVALGALVGLVMVIPPSIRMPGRLGMGVLIASGARLLFMLGMAVVVLMLLKPAGGALFGAVGCGGVLCIIFEAAWATGYLRRVSKVRPGALLA
jgi:hypothetical protein